MNSSAATALRSNQRFLALWAADAVSQVGTQISLLAIPFLAITGLHASALQVALLSTLEVLFLVAASLPAGVWLDRHSKQPALIVCDLVRATALASIPVTAALGGVTLGQLYAVAAVVGLCSGVFDVGQQSLLPGLVAPGALVSANSAIEATRSVAQIGGPGLAGLLIAAVGAGYAVSADAGSYLLSAALILTITGAGRPNHSQASSGGREPSPQPPPQRAGSAWSQLLDQARHGLAFVWRNRLLRAVAASLALANLFGSAVTAVSLLFVVRQLHLSSSQVGLALSLGNAGALVASLLVRPATRRLGIGRTLIGASLVAGAGPALLAGAPVQAALAWVTAGILVSAIGVTAFNITSVSLRQTITPPELLGRMTATMRVVVWGTIPVGSVGGGLLATAIGLRPTLAVAAVGALTSAVPLIGAAVWRVPSEPQPITPGRTVT